MSKLQELLGIEFKEGLTEEDLTAALEKKLSEKPDESSEITRLKDLLSRKNSEAADYKKKWQSQLSEAEKAEEERREKDAALEKELQQLRHEKAVSAQTAEFVSLGFDAETASANAEALLSQDYKSVFDSLRNFVSTAKDAAIADAIRGTKKPVLGSEKPTAKTKEDLQKMSPKDYLAFAQEHPDEYKEIYGGNDNG